MGLPSQPPSKETRVASDAERTEFMKLEYQAVVDKLGAMREDLSRTETIYPFAMFAIYAWLFTHRAPVAWLWSLGMTLPAIIAILGMARIRGRLRLMALLEAYSRRIESQFYGSAAPQGWEHLYRERRPMRGVSKFRAVAGIALLAGSLLLSGWAWGAAIGLWQPEIGAGAANSGG
jgi:hypothetical protein